MKKAIEGHYRPNNKIQPMVRKMFLNFQSSCCVMNSIVCDWFFWGKKWKPWPLGAYWTKIFGAYTRLKCIQHYESSAVNWAGFFFQLIATTGEHVVQVQGGFMMDWPAKMPWGRSDLPGAVTQHVFPSKAFLLLPGLSFTVLKKRDQLALFIRV